MSNKSNIFSSNVKNILSNFNLLRETTISPALVQAKLFPQKTCFLELEIFKEQLGSMDPFLLTYDKSLNKVRLYRTIFFGIALAFIALGTWAFYQNFLFVSLFLGNLSIFAKGTLTGLSFSFALLAIAMGYSLSVAKEASALLASKANQKLRKLYMQKRLEYGWHGIFILSQRSKFIILKQKYLKALDEIQEQKNLSVHLLAAIHKSASFAPKYREVLFNQALIETSENLQHCLQRFAFSLEL